MFRIKHQASSILLIGLTSCYSLNAQAFESTYEKIQWDKRGSDTLYCIDITDEKYQVHPWLQALTCGENLYTFSPKDYLSNTMKRGDLMPGTKFGWRIWSKSGYGGNGYEGVVTVQNCVGQPYVSSSGNLQWGCRNNDSFYCVDILDSQSKFVKQAAACNEGLHSFSPISLNLGSGNYKWKVWSNTGYGGNGFEGDFTVAQSCVGQSYLSTSDKLQWGCRSNDTFYCVDILNDQGGFVKQAAACSEGLHSFSPTSLNLGAGNYKWKVWSQNGYGGNNFEGNFNVAAKTTPVTTTSACSNFTSGTAAYNKCQSERLIGTWRFDYSIGSSPYSDRYTFSGSAQEMPNKLGYYMILDQKNKAGGVYYGDNSTGYKFMVVQMGTTFNQGYFFNLKEDGSGSSSSGCYYLTTTSNDPIGGCDPLTVTKVTGASSLSIDLVDPAQKYLDATSKNDSSQPNPEMRATIRELLQELK
jgi:hypothetical protein